MKLNFLDSGLDSLKKGFKSLVEYEKVTFYNKEEVSEEKRFYHLKDAILFIQHGIEILVKKIIQNHSEYLIFSQIDNHVKSALKQKNERKLNSVFETDLKHKIHTVTFNESIERLKIIPGVKLSSTLEKRLNELESYRNIIMHSEPYLNEYDINTTFDGLSDELDSFFFENIGETYKMISGYDELMKNIEIFKELLKDKGLDLKIKSVEVIVKALKKAKISIGSNEVKRITNVDSCSKFLEELINSDLTFGTDLYNGFCSGAIEKFKRSGESLFEFYAAENQTSYQYKIKSIIIYIPPINNDKSPIIFVESDNMEFDSKDYDGQELDVFDEIKSFRYLKSIKDNEFVYKKEKIYSILESSIIQNGNYEDYYKFFTKGIFCFLNIQGLDYNPGFKRFIWQQKTMDGKQFEVVLREVVTK
ncbi:MAG: hypothetical protein KDC67_02785 [Ignavibacteriae bacterium]|nr:hypothetical protein [Ignavibacteriota bacterium]